MQYTLDELIDRLEDLRREVGGFTPIQFYSFDHINPRRGVDCWLDNCEQTGEITVILEHIGYP